MLCCKRSTYAAAVAAGNGRLQPPHDDAVKKARFYEARPKACNFLRLMQRLVTLPRTVRPVLTASFCCWRHPAMLVVACAGCLVHREPAGSARAAVRDAPHLPAGGAARSPGAALRGNRSALDPSVPERPSTQATKPLPTCWPHIVKHGLSSCMHLPMRVHIEPSAAQTVELLDEAWDPAHTPCTRAALSRAWHATR